MSTTRRAPCSDHPDDWDLDSGSPESWRRAIATCHSCELLASCSSLASTLTAQGQSPRAMIWAGVPYDNSGNVIDDLDRYRSGHAEPRRPTQIIRTTAPAAPPSGATAPAAQGIVIHRGHRRVTS
jgi:hypothetical protein